MMKMTWDNGWEGKEGFMAGQVGRNLTHEGEWKVVREQAGSVVGHGGEAAKQNDQLRWARPACARI